MCFDLLFLSNLSLLIDIMKSKSMAKQFYPRYYCKTTHCACLIRKMGWGGGGSPRDSVCTVPGGSSPALIREGHSNVSTPKSKMICVPTVVPGGYPDRNFLLYCYQWWGDRSFSLKLNLQNLYKNTKKKEGFPIPEFRQYVIISKYSIVPSKWFSSMSFNNNNNNSMRLKYTPATNGYLLPEYFTLDISNGTVCALVLTYVLSQNLLLHSKNMKSKGVLRQIHRRYY